MIDRRIAGIVAAAALIAAGRLLTGCVGYQVGAQLPPGVRTVHVPTAVNQSSEPLIENDITRAIIAEIQRDGALRIVPADQADAVLNVTLRSYDLAAIAFSRESRSDPDEYRLTVEAAFSLVRSGTDLVLVEHPAAVGEATARIAGDFSSAKLTALPTVARDLARDIVRKIVEHW